MKTSFLISLLSALLISNECNGFGVPSTARTTVGPLTFASQSASTMTPLPQLNSHAIGQDDLPSPLDHQTMALTEETPAATDSETDMATVVSLVGLTMLAMMLGMSSGSHSPLQNIQNMDDGSAATLIVDAVFLGITGLVSVISVGGDDKNASDATMTQPTSSSDAS